MSQTDQILNHLKSGKSLTALDALSKFGCLRLAARILDLRERGYLIESKTVKSNGKTFSSYRLVEVKAA